MKYAITITVKGTTEEKDLSKEEIERELQSIKQVMLGDAIVEGITNTSFEYTVVEFQE